MSKRKHELMVKLQELARQIENDPSLAEVRLEY